MRKQYYREASMMVMGEQSMTNAVSPIDMVVPKLTKIE
jgi:hypothetical protein